jgi:hypothetical protein
MKTASGYGFFSFAVITRGVYRAAHSAWGFGRDKRYKEDMLRHDLVFAFGIAFVSLLHPHLTGLASQEAERPSHNP